ncbi:MAG: hypothetical protein DHS20C05_14250 [Hyphococcus sp.]|nr:MAG: hypothetical protein DHS20C05_14250 [Marinicaulis sp.]
MQKTQRLVLLASCALFAASCGKATDVSADIETQQESVVAKISGTMTAMTSDGVTIYGEPYFGELGADAPLILLFHQGGSNGRGEYAGIAKWLNKNGYRAIAWDQRAGGDRLGGANRTVEGLADGTPNTYCDAEADLSAALAHVEDSGIADKVIVWGSSYSAALVFKLAKDNPQSLAGLISFSPAGGGPLENCRARMWVDDITVPMFVLRPQSEMENPNSIEQRDILTTAGVEFMVVENGVHGSSMLVDDRTKNDMSAAREAVLSWLEKTKP